MQIDFSFPDETPLVEMFKRVFEDWVEERKTSGSHEGDRRKLGHATADIYREMWQAFTEFCVGRDVRLESLSVAVLEAFLAARAGVRSTMEMPTAYSPLSARYARRFLTLIDKVARHQAKRLGTVPNTAAYEMLQRPEFRYAEAADKDPLPEYLKEDESDILIAYVTGSAGREDGQEMHWKTLRDHTAVAVMLGGGLAPGDVRSLRVGGVIVEGGRKGGGPRKLSVPGNGNSPARETPLAEWAGKQLALWLDVRTSERIAGEFVFPSTLSGKQWSHTRCYESCKAVLAQAGIAEGAGGLFILRHTFALRQLANGREEAEVARWLGLLDISGMARYRRIVHGMAEVV
jgi:site-specific recombinase XerD